MRGASPASYFRRLCVFFPWCGRVISVVCASRFRCVCVLFPFPLCGRHVSVSVVWASHFRCVGVLLPLCGRLVSVSVSVVKASCFRFRRMSVSFPFRRVNVLFPSFVRLFPWRHVSPTSALHFRSRATWCSTVVRDRRH